jgi:hypothetical protein
MTKAEMIVKVVMANINPHALFIEQYLKLLPDNTMAEFHKVLDMKGIKRADQAMLVELYKKMIPEQTDVKSEVVNDEKEDERGRIKKLEGLIKKRFPNN